MIDVDQVLIRTEELVRLQGGEVRSRQILALARALVEAINKELALKENKNDQPRTY